MATWVEPRLLTSLVLSTRDLFVCNESSTSSLLECIWRLISIPKQA